MRKTLVAFVLILLSLFQVFAGLENSERVWYYTDGGTYNVTSIDLSKTYYLPKYGTLYSFTEGDVGNMEDGTYAKKTNVIGNIGCAYTDHRITFTIETDGKFVSQSDPTKYRDFYVALKPRYRRNASPVNDDENFNWDVDSSNVLTRLADSERVPNTKNSSSVSVTTPRIPKYGSKNYSLIDLPGTGNVQLLRIFYDMCICMDELTAADKAHLKEGNDYLALITIRWSCEEGAECDDPMHNGSFVFALPGNYLVAGNRSSLYLNVAPSASSMDLNLGAIAASSPREAKIADIELYATTNTKDWSQSIFFFISAGDIDHPENSYWKTNHQNTFKLRNTKLNGYYIPYRVIVRDKLILVDDEGVPVYNETIFNGDEYFNNSSNTMGKGSKVDLSASMQSVWNKQGNNEYHAIAYKGEVFIELDQYAHLEGSDTVIPIAYSDSIIYPDDVNGIYTSYLFYYVVYK